MERRIANRLSGLVSLYLLGLLACTKTPSQKIPVTPLQTLVNTDTTLRLFHRMILKANDAGLLNDATATLFIPRNNVLRQAGYPESIIDSMSPALADRIIRYQYLLSRVHTDSAGYTPNQTLLGIPLYIGKDSAGNLLLNASATAANMSISIGKASVYWLNSLIPPGADSLTVLLPTDTSLRLFARIFVRTNLYDSLLLKGSFTVLAPVNTALRQAGYDSAAIDTAKIGALIQLAQNQVVNGRWFSTSFPSKLTTLTGGSITVNRVNGIPLFSGSKNPAPAHWLSGNQVAGAGLTLHRIDQVLSP